MKELLWIMIGDRSSIWLNRKTKPVPDTNEWMVAAINQGEEELDKIKHKTGRLHQEYMKRSRARVTLGGQCLLLQIRIKMLKILREKT